MANTTVKAMKGEQMSCYGVTLLYAVSEVVKSDADAATVKICNSCAQLVQQQIRAVYCDQMWARCHVVITEDLTPGSCCFHTRQLTGRPVKYQWCKFHCIILHIKFCLHFEIIFKMQHGRTNRRCNALILFSRKSTADLATTTYATSPSFGAAWTAQIWPPGSGKTLCCLLPVRDRRQATLVNNALRERSKIWEQKNVKNVKNVNLIVSEKCKCWFKGKPTRKNGKILLSSPYFCQNERKSNHWR